MAKGGVLPLSEALGAASEARASDAWAAVAIAKEATGVHGKSIERSKQSERCSRMGCHRHCKTQRAVAERSAERGKRSERYSRMSCRRRFKGWRACTERSFERNTRSECSWATATRAAAADGKGVVRAPSKESRAACDTSTTAASAATAIAKRGACALRESLSAASEASATAA